MAFTGDALFVDEVGRTDLYGPEQAERLASALYESIHQRILPLGDGAILCPGHGGGSVCGSRISDRDESSLGIERAQNPVLQLTKRSSCGTRPSNDSKRRPTSRRWRNTIWKGLRCLAIRQRRRGLRHANSEMKWRGVRLSLIRDAG